jgi:hypothetical protein
MSFWDDLRNDAEQQRQQGIRVIELDYAENIAAIEKLEALSRVARTATKSISSGKTDNSIESTEVAEWPGYRKAVRRTVRKIEGEFSVDDVEQRLKFTYRDTKIERSRLSVELWRLRTVQKKITQVREGCGRSVASYKKVEVKEQ